MTNSTETELEKPIEQVRQCKLSEAYPASMIIEFTGAKGHLDNDDKTLTLEGNSILTKEFTIVVKKLDTKPSNVRFHEGFFYVEANKHFYTIDVTIGEDTVSIGDPSDLMSKYIFDYDSYGLPCHVYTSICGAVLTLI